MASTWPELHAGTNFNYIWDTGTLAWVKDTGGGTGSGGAVTIADGADVAEGAKADSAWDGVTATATVVSILKRLIGSPNLDTTPTSVPTSSTAITASAAVLSGAHFINEDASVSRTVTITDTAGNHVTRTKIPAGGEQFYAWNQRPVTGIKWLADGANVKGHVWGRT